MYVNRIIQNIFRKGSLFVQEVRVKNNILGHKIFVRHAHKCSNLNKRPSNATQNINLSGIQNVPKQIAHTNKYTEQTCTCGDLCYNNIGQNVILCGWLEYQRFKKFIVLRDGYGEIQLIIKDNDISLQNLFNNLPYESIIKVEGEVVSRPQNMVNRRLKTGAIEVLINKAEVLNKASENLPFNIREYQKAKESLRMQYRYLDLRFPQMQFNLRTRSTMLMAMREFLIKFASFVDVETPTLFKSTPGGAQEFVVPTRFPGQFYSLVQSPQQFKQMLMAGSIDRYFQIARCYRDEGSRPDRQPEFTQLDIEMSFTNVDGVINIVEDLLQYSWPAFLDPLPTVFQRISYQQALEKYGTDKPDIRFGIELTETTNIFEPISKSQADFYSAAIVIDGERQYSASIKTKLKNLAKHYPNVRFLQSKVKSKNDWIQKIARSLNDEIASTFYDMYNLKEGNIVFLAHGPKTATLSLLGKIRLEYVNLLEEKGIKIRKEGMHMVWIVDFPLFELDNATGNLSTVHHPFTSPHPDDLHLLSTSPLNVRSLAYDLVLNGNEVGGGSIRIHNSGLQEHIFRSLNIDVKKMQHILDMLASGCPPHGGIALGLDRLLCIVLDTPTIRDVIAFPKTFEGRDPVSGAPSEITEHEKTIYHIKTVS